MPESCNTAQSLDHLPGQRGAHGPFGITEGTLLIIGESSMIPTPGLSGLIRLTEEHSAKVILAGDTGQLQAVETAAPCPH